MNIIGSSTFPILIIGIGIIGFILYVTLFAKKKPKLIKQTPQTQTQPIAQPASRQNSNIAKIGVQLPNISTFDEIKPDEVTTPEETIKAMSKEGVINALVLDNEHHTFGERHIELDRKLDYGRPLLYFNNLVFLVYKLTNGQILPVPISIFQDLAHSPAETYEAVKNTEDIKTLFGKRNNGDKTKIWMILLAIGVLAFIGFMATQSKKGG